MYNKYIFTKIYENDLFNRRSQNDNALSKSGSGSDLEQTREIIRSLPTIFIKYDIKSILDLPCGDFYWMKHLDLTGIEYIGGDIVASVVKKNNETFSKEGIKFMVINGIIDHLPKSDLVICRDLLVHLTDKQIHILLNNIRKSGSKYLLTTSFPNTVVNRINPTIGYWRPINLELPPFNLTDPIDSIFENCSEANGIYNDKHLLLYKLN